MIDEEPLLAANCLFHFSTPLRRGEWTWGQAGLDMAWTDAHELPYFRRLEQRPQFAVVHAAWSLGGLAFRFAITGKSQPIFRRGPRLGDSDGIQLWLATRDTSNIHRGQRYCHRFVLLPPGAESGERTCHAGSLPIQRATAVPNPAPEGSIRMAARVRPDGYELDAVFSNESLTGYDPAEHRNLAINYAIIDRELGWQTLSLGPEYPIAEVPSLWCGLRLVE